MLHHTAGALGSGLRLDCFRMLPRACHGSSPYHCTPVCRARRSLSCSRCTQMRTDRREWAMERSQARTVAQEAGSVRNAPATTEIPGPGGTDIFRRVYEEIGRDRVLLVAAGVTFYLLLAFAPALAALISLYGLFADPATISEHVSLLQGM